MSLWGRRSEPDSEAHGNGVQPAETRETKSAGDEALSNVAALFKPAAGSMTTTEDIPDSKTSVAEYPAPAVEEAAAPVPATQQTSPFEENFAEAIEPSPSEAEHSEVWGQAADTLVAQPNTKTTMQQEVDMDLEYGRESVPGNVVPVRQHDAGAEPAQDRSGAQLYAGPGLKMKGEIADCDSVHIEGTVEGTISARQLIISKSGVFRGTAIVEDADIEGRLDGTFTVHGCIMLRSTGHVSGSLAYGEIEIERGGKLTGEVEICAAAEASESRSSAEASEGKSLAAAPLPPADDKYSDTKKSEPVAEGKPRRHLFGVG